MPETFYSALDVAADASRETITRAYREKVKTHHPDVSDDPGSSRTFRRLTTARDVLVDEEERSRYDRLGHDAYVHRHVSTDVWTAGSPGESGPRNGGRSTGHRDGPGTGSNGRRTAGDSSESTAPSGGAPGTSRSATGSGRDRRGTDRTGRSTRGTRTDGTAGGDRTGEANRRARTGGTRRSGGTGAGAGPTGDRTPTGDGGPSAWLGEDWDPGAREQRERDRERRAARYRSYHGSDGEDWQQASPMYQRRSGGDRSGGDSPGLRLLDVLRRVGPWLGVHVIFIASAIATGLFAFTSAGTDLDLSLSQYVLAGVMLTLILVVSVLHLVSLLSTR